MLAHIIVMLCCCLCAFLPDPRAWFLQSCGLVLSFSDPPTYPLQARKGRENCAYPACLSFGQQSSVHCNSWPLFIFEAEHWYYGWPVTVVCGHYGWSLDRHYAIVFYVMSAYYWWRSLVLWWFNYSGKLRWIKLSHWALNKALFGWIKNVN